MRNPTRIILVQLLLLGFSISICSQSRQQNLDQVGLMKYFTGTWEAEIGKDSTFIWEFIPAGKGYEANSYLRIQGEVTSAGLGIIGFTKDYNQAYFYRLQPDGTIAIYSGQFESDTKFTWEMFTADNEHITMMIILNIIAPDEFIGLHIRRGMKDTWKGAVEYEFKYKKVKH